MWTKTRNNQKKEEQFLKEAGIFIQNPYTKPQKKEKKRQKIAKVLIKQEQISLKIIQQSIPTASIQKSKQDEDHSTISHTLYQSKSQEVYNQQGSSSTHLCDIIKIPSYLKIEDNRVVKGYLGHNTVIFHHPIIEGSYYCQIKILPLEEFQPLKNSPAVRIGICTNNYNIQHPLGLNQSYGYNTYTGSLIHKSSQKKISEPCKQNDIIGIGVHIDYPKKHRNKSQISFNSYIKFYKNGIQIGEQIKNLTQQFYYLAISLYNYAKVQINYTSQFIKYRPEQFQPYINLKNTKIIYKDLKNLSILNS